MDEPTSSLSQAETENLFVVIKDLRARGVSVIYISHRLGEVKELSDHATVLRDGENAGELSREEVTHEAMVRLMVGRDLSDYYERKDRERGDLALEVSKLRTPAHPQHELTFSIASGEIVAVAGLVGAGRTEMLETLFWRGARPWRIHPRFRQGLEGRFPDLSHRGGNRFGSRGPQAARSGHRYDGFGKPQLGHPQEDRKKVIFSTSGRRKGFPMK